MSSPNVQCHTVVTIYRNGVLSYAYKNYLRNSLREVYLDAMISISLIAALGLQLHRLQNHPSTQGVSPEYLLLNALFNNAQLSEALLHIGFGDPDGDDAPVLDLIQAGRLKGVAALGGLFGFLHLLTTSIILVLGGQRPRRRR